LQNEGRLPRGDPSQPTTYGYIGTNLLVLIFGGKMSMEIQEHWKLNGWVLSKEKTRYSIFVGIETT
jgi:hypothetical protein